MPNLADRIRTIATDVVVAGNGSKPTLRDEFETFKEEITQQVDDLRKDFQQVLEAQQSGN